MNLTLINRHPFLRPPANRWRTDIRRLVALVARNPRRYPGFSINDLSVVWMNDRRIREANLQFLRHQGPTDVLTFNYGQGMADILVSLDTAQREAARRKRRTTQELTLYLAHGILHLAGLNDKTPPQRRRMRREEQWLLRHFATESLNLRTSP
ncbi:MAG: rRNA maturation RNase YbeY [Verrucomicrobia bacterium]|nr:rRNA maturation RNase YbeY [Verrucomicrobiota bacterium]